MSVPVRDYLKNRRDRALGMILGHFERSAWWKQLDDARRKELRAVVIDALNGYHDSVLDLVKAEDNTVVRNEEVVNLLNRIDVHMQRQAAATHA